MSGRLLDFKQYIGGSDQVITVELFPRDQRTYSYNFNRNVTGYTFSGDYQSILLDTVTYDRQTGLPNFADTSVLGYFDNYATIASGNFDTSGATTGVVLFKIPPSRYTGPVLPNARTNVVATVVSFQWDDGSDINTHRYVILERWEPGVSPGDPQVDANFVPFGVGAITAITDNASANATRATITQTDAGIVNAGAILSVTHNGSTDATRATAAGTYTVSGLTSGIGTGAQFQVVVKDDGEATVNILNRGQGYAALDTITILDSAIGGSGAENITITVSAIDTGTADITSQKVVFNNVTGLTSGAGAGAQFQAIVETDGDVTFNITSRGSGYSVNDTITILDSSLGNSGADNITITISSVS